MPQYSETEKKRIAKAYRNLLNRGMLKKLALREIILNHGIKKTSLYKYCKLFGVSTK